MREPHSSSAASEYYFRRRLAARELLPAIGVGVGAGLGAGLIAFYIAKLLTQRTALKTERRPRSMRREPIIARSQES